MTDREFIDMMLDERIKVLLSQKLNREDAEILSAGEKVIDELGESEKHKVLAFLNRTAEMEAENEKRTYVGGVYDGIRLCAWISRIGEGKET